MQHFSHAGQEGFGDLLYNNVYVVDNTELYIWKAEFMEVIFATKKHIPHLNINFIYNI